MSEYNFDRVLQAPNFEIKIDTAAGYGYFEHNELGDNCGGGLWFERLEGGMLSLTDYDGVFALPSEVKATLLLTGFIVDEDF
jgi:hypothetical protein